MVVILFVPLLVVGAVVALVLQHRHGRVEPTRFLRVIALSLAILFALFGGLFIVGETAEDPGGAVAAVLVTAWLLPMAVLTAVAWWLPRVAGPVLGVLVAAVVGVGAWYAAAPDAWRAFEDDHGPVRALAVFALSLPLAVLAWRRPVLGGALLLVLGVVPGALALVATGGGGAAGATVAASSPAALVGVLDLAVGWLQHRGAAPPAVGRAAAPPGALT